jgi:hypothetical protein
MHIFSPPKFRASSADRPLSVLTWDEIARELSPVEKGQALFSHWLKSIPGQITAIDNSAINNFPPDIVAAVQECMLGSDESYELCIKPEQYPLWPDYTDYIGNRRYTIVSAAIDVSSYEHYLLVMLEDREGSLFVPQLSSDKFLFGKNLIQSNSAFCGLIFQISHMWDQQDEFKIPYWSVIPHIFLDPILEATILDPALVSNGKIGNLINEVLKDYYNQENVTTNLAIQLDQKRRAATIVSRIPVDNSWYLIEYAQAGGILGQIEEIIHFPHKSESFQTYPGAHLSHTDKLNRLQEMFELNPVDSVALNVNPRFDRIAHAAIGYYFDLDLQADISKVVINPLGSSIDKLSGKQNNYSFTFAFKVETKDGKHLLPLIPGYTIISEQETEFLISFKYKNAAQYNPEQAMDQLLKKLKNPDKVYFINIGATLPSQAFCEQLDLMHNKVEGSLFFEALQLQLYQILRPKSKTVDRISISEIRFIDYSAADSDLDTIQIAVEHNLGYSFFTLYRNRDTGFIPEIEQDSAYGLRHDRTVYARPFQSR